MNAVNYTDIVKALGEIDGKCDRMRLVSWLGYPYGFDEALANGVARGHVLESVKHTRGGVRFSYSANELV
jgi:hypothetical protein